MLKKIELIYLWYSLIAQTVSYITYQPCCQRLINSQTKGSFGRQKIAQLFQLQIPSLFLR